ncbi:MAG: 2-hydroxychromene-2-carboxylate isomerase [Gammaproteobacteria bacterium]|nr:MAG: 2-hydroxychromene-2-carboxylate isomerase [Gammaproteobacteria bacterium]
MSVIEYFYAAHSAYAYIGSVRFMQIATAAGRTIEHRPIDLNRVVNASGSVPFSERSPGHRAYFFSREMKRWSEQRGVSLMDHMPTHHGNDIALANGLLIAGLVQGLNIDSLAYALLAAHWTEDADLADPATLATITQQAGYAADPLLEAATDKQILDIYAANTEEAIERSVFGSPTYFVDGDMFYGQDRLEMVERALTRPYA